ncbi:MAG TPA: ATP-binding protein, partial [Magnetospirillaceae bacterium]|nr:ATP-binding protein [Magnetospirillaceae bacterium]
SSAQIGLWRGCRILSGRKPLFWVEAIALAGLAFLYYYFTQIDLDVNWRVASGSLVVAAAGAKSLHDLLREKSLLRWRGARLIIVCQAVMTVLFLIRALVTLRQAPITDYLHPGLGQVIALALPVGIYLVLALGVFWLMFERIEDEMEHRNQALEAARIAEREANKAKSAFLANMSHEIRTPMNGIIGCTDILLDMTPSPQQKPYLDMLRDAEKLLLTIINDILDFSKLETAQFTLEKVPVELASTVRGCLDLVRSQAIEKGLSLDVTIDPALPAWLIGDPARLRQILLNLLGNAVKFTQEGGIWLRISAYGEEGMIRFAVSDTGIGIPEERRHLLFQDFSQAHQSGVYGGTGLGLAICKRLVIAMGGDIGMESEAGRGSLFWFAIPLTAAEMPSFRAETALDTPDGKGAKVLVAEDVKVNQVILERLLTRAGHEVTLVENGADALAAVLEQPFDVIFMDMRMPVMDGVAATEAIRALDGRAGQIPIVGLTANATPEDAARCREAGMNDHLVKPVDRATLLKAVTRWSPQMN